METGIIVAVIAAVASLLGAATGYWFSLWREQAGDWRKVKFEHYREFMTALQGVTGSDATPDGRKNFARSSTAIQLVASKQVVEALHALLSAVSESNPDRLREQHDQLVSKLVREIRSDLGVPCKQNPDNLPIRLWGSGINR